jgi:hypothetical protein
MHELGPRSSNLGIDGDTVLAQNRETLFGKLFGDDDTRWVGKARLHQGRSCTRLTHRLRSAGPALALALAFAVPLAIYIASLQSGVDFWDTGELQTVPYILGIAHPSGFPAYVLIGWVWSHAIPFGDPAYRMNLLSAVSMAGAALALAGSLIELGVASVAACGAALVFAVTRIPWDHAVHADVHPLALAALGAAFWAALRWGRTGSGRALMGCAGAAALALAVHSGTVLVVPGVVLAALTRRPGLRQAAACIGLGALIVAAAYAYLPLRSAAVYAQRLDPTLALGLPPGRPFWDADHPSTWAGFRAEVGGGEFGAAHALARLADPAVLRTLPESYGEAAVGDLAGGVMLIAIIGAFAVVRRAPAAWLGIIGGSVLPVLFVLAYPAESDPERYFLPSYWAIALFLGAGADLLARGGLPRAPHALTVVVGGLLLFVAVTDVYGNRGQFFAGHDDSAQQFIDRIVRETPPNAIVVAPWNYATPLAYAAYVQQKLGRRIVVTGWPEDYSAYYPGWLADRPITFVSDDPILSVPGVRVRERQLLTPAPHLFSALAALP